MVAFMIWLQNSTPSYSFIKANKKVANIITSNLEFWGLTSKNGSTSVINCVNVIKDIANIDTDSESSIYELHLTLLV